MTVAPFRGASFSRLATEDMAATCGFVKSSDGGVGGVRWVAQARMRRRIPASWPDGVDSEASTFVSRREPKAGRNFEREGLPVPRANILLPR